MFERQWLIFLMLELVRETDEDLALTERLVSELCGLRIARGMQRLYWRGAQFVARFDHTRVIYSVRFAARTAVKP